MAYIGQTPTAIPLVAGDITDGIIVNSHVNASAAIVGTKLTALAGNVAFPATQSASADANTLDDYEEGLWTPQVSDGTNDMTMSGSNGRYTKIGRVVYITSFVQTSSLGSATGNIQLDDLPFTSSSASSSSSGLHCSRGIGLAVTASVQVSAHILTNNTSCPLYTWDGTDGSSAMQASEWTADGACFFSGFYFV